MSTYKNLISLGVAAVFALGLAACSSSSDAPPPTVDPDPDPTPPPVTSACPGTDAASHTACVEETKTALDDAKAALAALLKTDYSVSQKKAADMAVADAQKDYDDAVTAQNTYTAMQPPTYDIAALEKAVEKQASTAPVTLGGGLTTAGAIDGGKVKVEAGSPAANTYSMATWPVGQLAGFDESVWERTIPSKDSVVVYTNVQAATGAKWNVYYPAGQTAQPSTGSASGREYKPWVGVSSQTVVAGTGGKGNTIGLLSAVTDSTRSLFDIPHGLSATTRTGTFADDTATTDVNENELKGKFNGVAGTFDCSSADTSCTISVDKNGKLTELGSSDNTWTFIPDSDATVAGVDLDADYLDFGYWVNTATVGGETSYKAAAFYQGSDPAGDVGSVTGSAEYTGGAAGLFTRKTFADDGSSTLTSGGRFTADAELTAYFGGTGVAGDDQFSISGTINQFKDSAGKLIDPAWSLSLMKAQGGTDWVNNASPPASHFSGSTTGEGEWSGNFYGDTGSGGTTVPPHVAGKFTGAFNNGDVLGSFGASK